MDGNGPEGVATSTPLLNMVQQQISGTGKGEPINRLILVSAYNPKVDGVRGKLASYYEQFVKSVAAASADSTTESALSGLLLCYPAGCIHVVESSAKVLVALLRDIRSSLSAKRMPLLVSTHVLISSESVGKRAFPGWHVRDISIPRMEHFGDSEAVEPLVAETCANMVKVGLRLSSLREHQLRSTLDTLRRSVADLLPSNDVVRILTASRDIIDFDQWMAVYDRSVDIALESELVWPLQALSYDHY